MIKIGTEFRASYADSNALWTVVKKKANDVWLCEIVNEPVEYDGKIFNGDYAGVQKVFLSSEIERSLNISDLFKNIKDDCEKFYLSLKEGDIVHYHNGFNQFVRCRITKNKDLLPIALVGNWRKHDLPKRNFDGQIILPHYARCVINGEAFKPNATNIYEYPLFKKLVDPTTLPETDLSVPEQTEEEKKISKVWVSIQEIQQQISIGHNDPNFILDKIKEIIAKA